MNGYSFQNLAVHNLIVYKKQFSSKVFQSVVHCKEELKNMLLAFCPGV